MLKSPASRTALFLAITSTIIIFGIHQYNQQLSTRPWRRTGKYHRYYAASKRLGDTGKCTPQSNGQKG